MSTSAAVSSNASASGAPPVSYPGTPSAEYLRIGALPASELFQIMQRGEAPSLDALPGWEWRGLNTMFWAPAAGIKKFVKGFYRDAQGGVWGYNIPQQQNPLSAAWIAQPSDANPKRFGYYTVTPVDPTSKDNVFLRSLLLDYGRGKNPLLDPSRTLRDYVVRVNKGSDELLLGAAFLALGPARVRVPQSYFVLERHRPTTWAR